VPNQLDAKTIRDLRRETGKGGWRVAAIAGISPETLLRWERGQRLQREPCASSVKKLADALSDLLGRQINPADLYEPETPTEPRVTPTTTEPTDAAA
jgi:transcriptional regulator with XRE-family HTH domain